MLLEKSNWKIKLYIHNFIHCTFINCIHNFIDTKESGPVRPTFFGSEVPQHSDKVPDIDCVRILQDKSIQSAWSFRHLCRKYSYETNNFYVQDITEI